MNAILQAILSDVVKFREAKKSLYTADDDQFGQVECVPWTSLSGKNGIGSITWIIYCIEYLNLLLNFNLVMKGMRDILLHLISIILKHGARSTGEPELRQRHYKNLVELIDFVLSSRRTYLESVTESDKHDVLWQQYETQRSALIFHFGE